MALLHLASLDGLRLQPGLTDTWWIAAILAVLFVAVAFVIERRTIDTPAAAKWRYAIIAFCVLAILHVAFTVGLRFSVWTPEEQPGRFHAAIAEPNYRALDNHLATYGNAPAALEQVEEHGNAFALAGNRVPYFRDAWGRELRYDAEADRLISAGADGEFGTQSDIVLPRPAATKDEEETDGATDDDAAA